MNAFYRAAALAATLLLAGCSHSTNTEGSRPQAWLQPGTKVTLPPPGITPAVSSQQLLTGSFNGQTQSLLVMLNADAHKVTLAGLSSVGIRLFLATYDETGIHTEQSIVVPQLPPASQVLADVMRVFYNNPLFFWYLGLALSFPKRLLFSALYHISQIDLVGQHGSDNQREKPCWFQRHGVSPPV